MKYTQNLGLKKPEGLENVLVEDLNENFDKIDEEISKISDPVTGVEAKLTTHLADMAKHNEFMQGNQKVRVVLGWNATLNCPTMEYTEVV